MLLHQALNVKHGDVISFVGAGGKTTAALRLMEELAGIGRRVVFTTTTKILEPIPSENEYLLLAEEEEALAQAPELLTHYPKVFLARRRLEEVDPTVLAEEHVHRPELVAGLTGAALGEPVTVEMVATVLSNPQGGLKGLPEHARAIPILNQMAEDRPLREAREIAHLILRNERVERVIIASLRAPQPVLEVMTNDQ